MPNKEWKKKNPARQKALQAGYRERNRTKIRASSKKYYRSKVEEIGARRRGVDPDTVPKKPKACQICGSGRRICLDHCHKTNKFRGWICTHCNVALAMVDDSSVRLRMLLDYLDDHDDLKRCP